MLSALPVEAAITVSLSVNSTTMKAAMPDGGIGIHTSVYANQFTNSALDDRLQEGVGRP